MGAGRIIIQGGTFTDVEGDFHHLDYSQHTTNFDAYNFIGNIIEDVNNSCPQTIYRGRNARLPRGRLANRRVVTDTSVASDAGMSFPMNNPSQFLFNTYARPGEAYPMGPSEELDIELPDDDGTEEVSTEEIRINGRPQSLAAGLERLTLSDERVSQPNTSSSHTDAMSDQAILYPGLRDIRQRLVNATSMATHLLHGTTPPTTGGMSAMSPAPIRASSSSAAKVDKGPKYVTIRGNYTQVDRSVHELNINSHMVTDNIIKDSFNEREEIIIQGQRPKARLCYEETGDLMYES